MNQIGMKEINDQYVGYVEDHFEENKETFYKSMEYLDQSTAKYHGETIYSLYLPKIFPEHVVEYLRESADTMYSILTKVIKEYLEDEDYRKLFGFSKELEELIVVDRLYESYLPIARIDIFLNEEDLSFQYCEFNADGTSSMNEDRELNIALTKTAAYQKLAKEYSLETFELFDSWVEEFMATYGTYKKKRENPRIAVVDFLEKGSSMEEFEMFCKSFRKAGYEAEVCEIRDLKYIDNILYSSSGQRIDAIYRRAVTSDIMAHLDEVPDFIQAVKDQNVCLVGSFCTQIIHNKILFKLLFEERTQSFLNEKEIKYIQEHIPYTVRLTDHDCDIDEVIKNKNEWIIKPEDSYGAQGVYAGITHTEKRWEELVHSNKNRDYLLQKFNLPYQSKNLDFHKEDPKFQLYSNLTGMYIYNGKFKGVYSRLSNKEIISTQYDENVIASLMAKEK